MRIQRYVYELFFGKIAQTSDAIAVSTANTSPQEFDAIGQPTVPYLLARIGDDRSKLRMLVEYMQSLDFTANQIRDILTVIADNDKDTDVVSNIRTVQIAIINGLLYDSSVYGIDLKGLPDTILLSLVASKSYLKGSREGFIDILTQSGMLELRAIQIKELLDKASNSEADIRAEAEIFPVLLTEAELRAHNISRAVADVLFHESEQCRSGIFSFLQVYAAGGQAGSCSMIGRLANSFPQIIPMVENSWQTLPGRLKRIYCVRGPALRFVSFRIQQNRALFDSQNQAINSIVSAYTALHSARPRFWQNDQFDAFYNRANGKRAYIRTMASAADWFTHGVSLNNTNLLWDTVASLSEDLRVHGANEVTKMVHEKSLSDQLLKGLPLKVIGKMRT
jgi:hypothetical protein